MKPRQLLHLLQVLGRSELILRLLSLTRANVRSGGKDVRSQIHMPAAVLDEISFTSQSYGIKRSIHAH